MVRTRGTKRRHLPFIVLFLALAAIVILWKPILRSPVEERPDRVGSGSGPVEDRTGPGKEQDRRIDRKSTTGRERERAAVPPVDEPAGRVVVIIDDVGYRKEQVEAYLGLNEKLTFSVIPFLADSRASARALHDGGFEVMIHIPMEPLSYPEHDPGRGALFVTDSRADVEAKLGRMIDDVGFAAGANNHMGSRATGNRDLMAWTMSYLGSQNLFFVDSRTTFDSFAYALARRSRVPAAERDVFLDNSDEPAYITARFEELRSLALREGMAVAIGHVQSTHLPSVLRHQIPLMKSERLELVFASEVAVN